jgi:hypothetical protein
MTLHIFHFLFETALSSVGVITLVGIALTGGSEPRWLWPRTRHEHTTPAIRAGRVLHWALAAMALIPLAFGILVGRTMDREPDAWATLAIGAAGAGLLAMLGRGIRYILADE